MGYITPADVGVSDDWQDHLDRNSAEPGTDYKTPYGTNLRIPDDCEVIGVDNSNGGPEGRRLFMLILANGETIDWIHLSRIGVRVGDRLKRGQLDAAWSGASGFGTDWYYGSHLHVTRRARRGLPYRTTLNFEDAIDHNPAPARNPEEEMNATQEAKVDTIALAVMNLSTQVEVIRAALLNGTPDDLSTPAFTQMLKDVDAIYDRIRGDKEKVDMPQDILGQIVGARAELAAATAEIKALAAKLA